MKPLRFPAGTHDFSAEVAGLRRLYQGDARAEFVAAIRDSGILVIEPERITADGRLRRFRAEGDKPGRRSGWAVLHDHGDSAAGAFGHYRLGIEELHWRYGRGPMDPAERERIRRETASAIERARKERELLQVDAAKRARALLRDAIPAVHHVYLDRKHIEAHGALQVDRTLLVPLLDPAGKLWNVQRIDEGGTKKFLYGGRTRGLYFPIGRPDGRLAVAEGFATAAAVFEACGVATAAAFSAANLEEVARALREKFPTAELWIAADNDRVGLEKAQAAAAASGARVMVPPEPGLDFCDLWLADRGFAA